MPPKRATGKKKEAGPIVVTVSDAKLPDIEAVARQLVAKGMTVERVMPTMGVISGTAATVDVAALRDVDGVQGVERELAAGLPPPDSETQ